MITLRRAADRGRADLGWLDARYTFSFADYRDPAHVHFGPLRVLNQDRIQPGGGFPPHDHQDMEIVTYVLDGVLQHRDSMGNGSQILPGEVQVMSAGAGVTHSEFNASEDEVLELLQMWVFPRRKGTAPRYDQRAFAAADRQDRLCLVVSPDGAGDSLTIDQDARLFACLLAPDRTVEHALPPGRGAWLHVPRGRVRLDAEELGPGDGAAIRDEAAVRITGVEPAELVLWELSA